MENSNDRDIAIGTHDRPAFKLLLSCPTGLSPSQVYIWSIVFFFFFFGIILVYISRLGIILIVAIFAIAAVMIILSVASLICWTNECIHSFDFNSFEVYLSLLYSVNS